MILEQVKYEEDDIAWRETSVVEAVKRRCL